MAESISTQPYVCLDFNTSAGAGAAFD
eukprot:COSAG05_NODE_5907_length_1062_cov_1.009346_1_plen_26_part_10